VEQSRQLLDVAEVLVQEADAALAKSQKVRRRTIVLRLPDTVDPRGPKGK
jgi:hypothetical protein